MAQGALPFQYEAETAASGVTALGGLPVYLDLIKASGLDVAIRKHVRVAGEQGWLDLQMIVALIVLNLAGGDGLEDLERLEQDAGFIQVMREVERRLLPRADRRALRTRWRKPRRRAVPSPSAMADWLARFHDAAAGQPRPPGSAIIPVMAEPVRALWQVNQALLGFLQTHRRLAVATLDMDATLIETHKREALPCYKGFKAYQPLTCWWAEQGVVLHSEFRDGNVPAGYQQLRVLKDCLATAAATGVTKVYLRSDSAGYQQDLLLYCGEGKDARFGVIEFAVSADVTEEFRKAARAVAETDWQPLYRTVEGQRYRTDQEFAEVCFVPAWAGHSRRRADYRFLAIREPLRQLDLADAAQLPFPTRILKNWWQQCGADRRGKLTQGDSASPLIVSRWRHDNPSGAAQPGRSLRRGVAVSGRQLAGDRGAARGQGGGADRREYPAERAEWPTEPEAEQDGERHRSLAATARQGRSPAATPGASTAQERPADCR